EISRQSPFYRTNHFSNRYRAKDGSYRELEWTTTFNRDEATRFGVARDVTEERQWKASLKESEERFRIMADSCPTIIWVTGPGGALLMANRMCQEFFGAPFEQADTAQAAVLLHPHDHAAHAGAFHRAAAEQQPFHAE